MLRPRTFLVAVVLVVASVPVFPQGHAAAQFSSFERIDSYEVDIRVERDGTMAVKEKIAYDFGSLRRHGIFRTIPVRFHYDDKYDRVYPIKDIRVDASAGTPHEFSTSSKGADLLIKIGDADKTITGAHTYEISYVVRGALNSFPEHVELYWNVVGGKWPVPIERVQARISAPEPIRNVACYAGLEGSRLNCAQIAAEGDTATFGQGHMGPFQGLTAVLALPKGAVSPAPKPILRERWSLARAFALTPLTVSLAGVLLAAAAFGIGWLLWAKGRDRRFVGSATDVAFGNEGAKEQRVGLFEKDLYPTEFVPPDGIRPGQVGTLLDEAANPLDVTATIVDLAVRGYLRIQELPAEGWFKKPDWHLTRLREPDDLLSYERILFDGIFKDGTEVDLSDLRQHFLTRLHKVQDRLYANVVEEGWFAKRPDKVRASWTRIGVLVLVLGAGLTALAAVFTHLALIPLPIAFAGLTLLVVDRWMPHRTAKGSGMLRRVYGFRHFIETAEADKARFAEKKNLFSEYLPFAVVFGCTDKWARTFEGLGGEPPETSWYVSAHPFTFVAFSSAMDSFSTTTSGSIAAATPSSSGSSGFGGGGFSGGGGGGGGGGSW